MVAEMTQTIEQALTEMRELRAQVEALVRVANAREQFINRVMTSLGEFEFDREINGGDFVDQQGELYRDLLQTPGLEMDFAPKVIRLADGTFRAPNMDIVDDLDEAGAFFGPQALDPDETLVELSAARAQELAQSPKSGM